MNIVAVDGKEKRTHPLQAFAAGKSGGNIFGSHAEVAQQCQALARKWKKVGWGTRKSGESSGRGEREKVER